NQGFDGIYMDIIDGYYYWSVENPEQTDADSLMCQFIIDIRNHVNTVTGNTDFILIPQNGEDVWDQGYVSPALKSAYFNSINGIGVEDVFFPGSLDEDNPYNPDTYRIGILQEYLLNNKQVYSVEYLTDPAKITQYENDAAIQNYVPYACTRALDYLCGGIVLDMDDLKRKNIYNVRFSPNPTHNDILLTLNLPSSEVVSFIIYNIEGRVIKNLMDNIN
ncbi:MAG TPA: hypothetical protein ENH82_00660, partial [bacterium]|nr:hypothetical protein [bacterium]